MYSLKQLRYIRDLEFFLFSGVPEEAEEMYERDFHGHSEIRTTRRPIPALRFSQPLKEPTEELIISIININWSTGKVGISETGGESANSISLSMDRGREKEDYPPEGS